MADARPTAAVARPAPDRPRGLRARLASIWRTLLTAGHSPRSLAAAVALGIFCGCSPFYGFHSVLSLGLASLLELNPLIALAASQISLPPMGAGIIGAEVALGERLRFGRWTLPSLPSVHALAPWLWHHALLSWAIGSAVFGGLLAVAGGLAVWGLVHVARRRPWRSHGRARDVPPPAATP
jgi:uncharacterized protein (DUF2062 family)